MIRRGCRSRRERTRCPASSSCRRSATPTAHWLPTAALTALPPPSEHDLFFDIEGDPFAFWEGLEYLFGVWDGAQYQGFWAMNRAEEKQQFEKTMDLFHGHWQQHRDMHIYHYGSYEPSRMKQLAGRHATRQDELDDLLRGRVFVDLLRVVRQGVLVGSERYSIKNLEPLYGFERTIELRDAGSSIVEFEKLLEMGDPTGELQNKILDYNKDDTVSTELLRNWLEARRPEVELQPGEELPRAPRRGDAAERRAIRQGSRRARARGATDGPDRPGSSKAVGGGEGHLAGCPPARLAPARAEERPGGASST